jgi:hypothetical protein
MATLSDRDARAWGELAERISATVEPRLGGGVLANRTMSEASSWHRLGPALKRARVASAALAVRTEAVIRTDVRAFYPSVTPAVTFRALVEIDPEVAAATADMLDGWGSEGYGGLPIGPPGSAVMANAILKRVDDVLEPFPHLRWVDDYLIGLARPRDVPEALERLDCALEGVGLQRSAPKTALLERGRGLTWPGTYGAHRPSE